MCEDIVDVHETAVPVVQLILFILTDYFKKTHHEIINHHIWQS